MIHQKENRPPHSRPFLDRWFVVVLFLSSCSVHDHVSAFAPGPIPPQTSRFGTVAVTSKIILQTPCSVPITTSSSQERLKTTTTKNSVPSKLYAINQKQQQQQHDQSSPQRSDDAITKDVDDPVDVKRLIFLVGGQSLLIGAAVLASAILDTPNYGLGSDIAFSGAAVLQGAILALPMGILAAIFDRVEPFVPALQEVTKATQRSVLAVLGGTWNPRMALIASVALGLAAGVGEEMLFRGVLQYELGTRFGDMIGVAVASVVFGALHAVTPFYAILAGVASIYFGYLYLWSGNLAVPISTHALYDVGALLYAHWTIANMSAEEREAIMEWKGPMDS